MLSIRALGPGTASVLGDSRSCQQPELPCGPYGLSTTGVLSWPGGPRKLHKKGPLTSHKVFGQCGTQKVSKQMALVALRVEAKKLTLGLFGLEVSTPSLSRPQI